MMITVDENDNNQFYIEYIKSKIRKSDLLPKPIPEKLDLLLKPCDSESGLLIKDFRNNILSAFQEVFDNDNSKTFQDKFDALSKLSLLLTLDFPTSELPENKSPNIERIRNFLDQKSKNEDANQNNNTEKINIYEYEYITNLPLTDPLRQRVIDALNRNKLVLDANEQNPTTMLIDKQSIRLLQKIMEDYVYVYNPDFAAGMKKDFILNPVVFNSNIYLRVETNDVESLTSKTLKDCTLQDLQILLLMLLNRLRILESREKYSSDRYEGDQNHKILSKALINLSIASKGKSESNKSSTVTDCNW